MPNFTKSLIGNFAYKIKGVWFMKKYYISEMCYKKFPLVSNILNNVYPKLMDIERTTTWRYMTKFNFFNKSTNKNSFEIVNFFLLKKIKYTNIVYSLSIVFSFLKIYFVYKCESFYFK